MYARGGSETKPILDDLPAQDVKIAQCEELAGI